MLKLISLTAMDAIIFFACVMHARLKRSSQHTRNIQDKERKDPEKIIMSFISVVMVLMAIIA